MGAFCISISPLALPFSVVSVSVAPNAFEIMRCFFRSIVSKAVLSVKKVAGLDNATNLERQRQKEREELYNPPKCELILLSGAYATILLMQ